MVILSPVQSNQLTVESQDLNPYFTSIITDLMLFSWKLNASEVQFLFAYKRFNVS